MVNEASEFFFHLLLFPPPRRFFLFFLGGGGNFNWGDSDMGVQNWSPDPVVDFPYLFSIHFYFSDPIPEAKGIGINILKHYWDKSHINCVPSPPKKKQLPFLEVRSFGF